MRTQTRTLLAVVALAVLVAMAGCADGDSTGPADEPPVEEIQAEAAAVAGNLSSAAFSMTMNVDSPQGSLTMQSDGVVDVDTKRMRMNITVESGGRTSEITQYIVDETAYQEANGQWQSVDVSGMGIWAEGNQLNVQGEMLENSTANVTGTAEVGGQETWVVSIQPSDEGIQQFLAGTATGVTENLELENVTVTQYVDTETYHVRQIEMSIETTSQGETATIEMTQTFSRFDEAFDITVPEAATQ